MSTTGATALPAFQSEIGSGIRPVGFKNYVSKVGACRSRSQFSACRRSRERRPRPVGCTNGARLLTDADESWSRF